MSTNWSGIDDINSILRKSSIDINQERNCTDNCSSDLLVFGYACKIFRDDEKAIYIDQGKHLIPWMGDESLKIDRYDVRATFSDLSQYEPPPGGYINRLDYLNPAEQRAEQLCEEERYYSLYHNEEDEQMYQEEELKRLQQQTSSTSSLNYGQVHFDYDKDEQSVTANESSLTGAAGEVKLEELDEFYIPPVGLSIPESIEKPETMKLHAIIEKTAKFISTQGPQMEILIKAKQSNNPQFEFLNINNRLNPYYKFILKLFKDGLYPVQSKNDTMEDSSGLSQQQNSDASNNFAYPTLPIPTIKYKPSANCAYTQLISKIKGVPLPPEQSNSNESNLENTTPTLLTHHAYQTNLQNITMNNESSIKHTKKHQKMLQVNNEVQIKKISTGLALAQCYASDTEEEENEHSETEKQLKVAATDSADADVTCTSVSINAIEESFSDLNFPIPPDNLRHVIDKTASYVMKNGQQFEDILRTKNDERFTFLNSDDEYHAYYMYKVTGIVHPYPTSNAVVKEEISDSNILKTTTPVSFSIKTKEETPVSIKPALPQEISDDETEIKNTEIHNDGNQTNCIDQNLMTNQNSSTINPLTKAPVPEHVQRAIQLVENQLMNRGAQYAAAVTSAIIASSNNVPLMVHENVQKSKFDTDHATVILNRSSPPSSVKSENIQQKKFKRAEEKVKDRLAQIAREKLGLISKEKQLQLERKKKAMAFLNQIKHTRTVQPTSSVSSSSTDQIENKNSQNYSESNSDTDSSSVHSVPMLPTNYDANDNKNQKSNKINLEISSQELRKCATTTTTTHSRSRSRSRSSRSLSKRSSPSHKQHKKKSKHHNKKKSKKKSRSRSGSRHRSVAISIPKSVNNSSSSSNYVQNHRHHHRRRTPQPPSNSTSRDKIVRHKRHSSFSPSRKLKKKKRD